MHRALCLVVLGFSIGLTGCGAGAGGQRSLVVIPSTDSPVPATSNSGIEVIAFGTRVDTSSPSLRYDRKPLPSAGIVINRAADNAFVVRGATGSDGRIRFALDPGEYAVIPQNTTAGSDTFQAVSETVSVSRGSFVAAQIEYESVQFGARF